MNRANVFTYIALLSSHNSTSARFDPPRRNNLPCLLRGRNVAFQFPRDRARQAAFYDWLTLSIRQGKEGKVSVSRLSVCSHH